MEVQEKRKDKIIRWLKKLGPYVFLFYLIKGIAWLFVFAFAAEKCGS